MAKKVQLRTGRTEYTMVDRPWNPKNKQERKNLKRGYAVDTTLIRRGQKCKKSYSIGSAV